MDHPSDSFHETIPLGWQVLRFVLHLGALYATVFFCTPWLAGWTRETVLPVLQQPTSSNRFQFLFSHIPAFSVVPAFVAGLIMNAKLRHRVARLVWLIPAMILLYKFITFPVPSVLQGQIPAAFHYYFEGGFLVPEFREWRELVSNASFDSDMKRGIAQLNFSAPFYGGIAYSVAAWLCLHIDLTRKRSSEDEEQNPC